MVYGMLSTHSCEHTCTQFSNSRLSLLLLQDTAVGIMVEESNGKLSSEDIVVDVRDALLDLMCMHSCNGQVVKFDYGMKEKNPVEWVWFYSKDDPTKPIKVHQNQVRTKSGMQVWNAT